MQNTILDRAVYNPRTQNGRVGPDDANADQAFGLIGMLSDLGWTERGIASLAFAVLVFSPDRSHLPQENGGTIVKAPPSRTAGG